VLIKTRQARGAIDFETTETRIVFGPERKIERIVPVVRNDAHRLIEECMILANVCTAKFLLRHKVPTLLRVHAGPTEEKLTDLRAFLAELGLRLGGGKAPEARHYAELLRKVQGRPDTHLIQTVMLRSLKQAVYSPENLGHFGLAHEAYAHFTSPIRRYPDLLVHRAIRHALAGARPEEFIYPHAAMVSLGEHCSTTERRADDATRDAIAWLKCEYMMDKVGQEFDGIITGVAGFGIFVELNEIYVEGMVHVTALSNDYYHFDPAKHRLMGERTNKTYRLADPVRVKVMRVDLDDRKIDFELADQAPAKAPAARPEPAGHPFKSRRKRRRRKD
jgi:ribonuclease R